MTRKLHLIYHALFIVALLALSSCLFKASKPKDLPNPVSDKTSISKKAIEADVPLNPQRNLYFGDLHVHTTLSADAYIGGTVTTPDEAYRFAQGEEITVYGKKVKISKPLDFTAVTDHSELLGEMYSQHTPGADGYNGIVQKYLRSIYKTDSELGVDSAKVFKALYRLMKIGTQKKKTGTMTEAGHPFYFKGYETTKSAWAVELKAVEKNYLPGKFTTLAGYEWTKLSNDLGHLHRNIIFGDMTVPDYPMSFFELHDEEQLWNWLKEITQKGAKVLAIPHNTNLSGGGTFTDNDPRGKPIDKKYAQLRQDFEPLIEIHQAKGNSEVDASVWKNDEFAGFENYSEQPGPPIQNSYVRYALKKGLEYQKNLGVNPFKFGIIGSTDTHNGTPGNTVESDEHIGNNCLFDNSAEGRKNISWPFVPANKLYQVVNPGGLVAVWAEANTRPCIFGALKRKETYATSGNRIQARFFCGYGFASAYNSYNELVEDGYSKGVPMGSDIPKKEGQTPEFIIWAMKDPDGANLDRIQVIKGWYKDGKQEEKIFTVALSDNRKLSADGKVPDNGATVDMKTGAWSKDKGDAELKVVWKDPEFDKTVSAFYYVRILEVPTASWRLWDQIRYGIKYPANTDLVIRERAWTSPIWYNP